MTGHLVSAKSLRQGGDGLVNGDLEAKLRSRDDRTGRLVAAVAGEMVSS